MEIGVLYLSHAMLVLAELIVCSTRGFACILAKCFWPTEISLSFTYGSPEASCNKRADTYLGRRSASLMKEFWTLCIFVMTVSETVMVETIPYSNIGLTHMSVEGVQNLGFWMSLKLIKVRKCALWNQSL